MLAQLVTFFRPAREQKEAYLLYSHLVQQARNETFFSAYSVPDTLDGRFELIVLHLFLILERLKTEPAHEQLTQFVSEAFFDDMDRSLREMGVGDTGVGRRVQKMSEALYGRMKSYNETWNDSPALKAALARNLYGTVEAPADAVLNAMCRYLQTSASLLKNQDILNETPTFASLS